jgi:ABC-2 type transport system permease protein
LVWGAIVFVFFIASAQGYQNLYPDAVTRRRFATSVGSESGFAALLGRPLRLETTGGFVAWRTGIVVAVMLGLWGALLATRLLRGEEDAGRWETLASAPLTRSSLTRSVLTAIAFAGLVPLAGAFLAACVVSSSAHVTLGDAAWLSVAWALCALAFAAFGAFASQCFAPRARATLVASVVLAVSYLLRMVADTEPRLGWLRWATPLGWLEEARVYAGTRPPALLLLVGWIVAFAGAAILLAARRDAGAALLAAGTTVRGRRSGLGNPLADAVRFVRGTMVGWAVAAAVSAFVLGLLAPSAARAIVKAGLEHQYSGVLGNIGTPGGYMGATFAFVVAALIAVSPSGHLTSAREEESSGRLDSYLAGTVSRRRWLSARIVVALGGACAMAVLAAGAGWLGQRLTGGDVGLVHLLAATACFVPLAMLFGSIGIAILGLSPRASHGIVATLVGFAVLVELVGSVVRAPVWVLDLSPFSHLGIAPAEPARAVPAIVMISFSIVLAGVGVEAFARRDLTGD